MEGNDEVVPDEIVVSYKLEGRPDVWGPFASSYNISPRAHAQWLVSTYPAAFPSVDRVASMRVEGLNIDLWQRPDTPLREQGIQIGGTLIIGLKPAAAAAPAGDAAKPAEASAAAAKK
jgi:hypothetical protein